MDGLDIQEFVYMRNPAKDSSESGIIRSGSVYIGQIGHILDVAYRGVDLFLSSLLLLEIVWDECIGHSDTS